MNKYSPKWVRQPYDKSCGQCCVAMITGLPLEFIVDQFKEICGHRGPQKSGTTPKEVASMLHWIGWESELYQKSTLWNRLQRLAIVHILNHWVVYFDGMIWDSCMPSSPMSVSSYGRRLKGFIEVKLPANA